MIKKILVPTDGSKHARRAIEYACDLALKYDAKVYLLHVIQKVDIPAGISEYVQVEGIEESPENVYLAKIGDKVVEVAEKDVKMKGVKDSQSVVLQGDPAERIVEFARKGKERGKGTSVTFGYFKATSTQRLDFFIYQAAVLSIPFYLRLLAPFL